MRPPSHVTRDPSLLVAMVVLFALPGSRLFAQFTENQSVPLNGLTLVHPCSLEPVTLAGRMTFSVSESASADGTTSIKIHMESHGVSATTTPTMPGAMPRKYVSDYTDDQTLIVRNDGPTVQTISTNWQFIRTGDTGGVVCCGDDWHLKITFHFTRQLNGQVTALVDNMKAECQ
jgi:hypothetical protein